MPNYTNRFKVEQSPHFEEIRDQLLQGRSFQRVSKWLKKEYDESISPSAIGRYYHNRINLNDRVEEAYNEIVSEEVTNEILSNTLAEEVAVILNGLSDVGKTLPLIYERMQEELKKSNPNVSLKDLASVAIQATKIYVDYVKSQHKRVDVQVQRMDDLFDSEFIAEVIDDDKEESDEEGFE